MVVAVSLDENGRILLVLHDNTTLDYKKVTEISMWDVGDEEPPPASEDGDGDIESDPGDAYDEVEY